MSSMDDLIAWLRVQLDEDERVARRVGGLRWRALDGSGELVASDGRSAEVFGEIHWEGVGQHIARWDPARVLAEVEAKRRIVDEAIELQEREGRYAEAFLVALAVPYADRPGYREDWQP